MMWATRWAKPWPTFSQLWNKRWQWEKGNNEQEEQQPIIPVSIVVPGDITANLDIDNDFVDLSDVDVGVDDDKLTDDIQLGGTIMSTFLEAIQDQLKIETREAGARYVLMNGWYWCCRRRMIGGGYYYNPIKSRSCVQSLALILKSRHTTKTFISGCQTFAWASCACLLTVLLANQMQEWV